MMAIIRFKVHPNHAGSSKKPEKRGYPEDVFTIIKWLKNKLFSEMRFARSSYVEIILKSILAPAKYIIA